MSSDRVPIPLQAIMGAFVPALCAAVALVVWALVTWPDPEGTRRLVLMLVPLGVLLAGSIVQHRFVRRAILVGMIDSSASPLLVTVLTGLASVIAMPLTMYVDDGATGLRMPWNRNSIGFSGFLALMLIWLSACAALIISRKTSK